MYRYIYVYFSEAHTFEKARFIGLELCQKQRMIQNLSGLTNGTSILHNISNKSNDVISNNKCWIINQTDNFFSLYTFS